MKHFERTLPAGYAPVYTVDAKKRSTVVLLNLAALALFAAVAIPAYLLIRPLHFFMEYRLTRNLALIFGLILYIVLHELTHGAAYKALTGEKLTFGLSLSVAYCGVPHIYVYRRAAMIALLAPFTVFTVVFLVLALLLQNPWDRLYAWILFAGHISGCVGDLYDAGLYLFRFRDPETLMQDTGPKQVFYQKGQAGD